MSTLQFRREANELTLLRADGMTIGTWDAANNVDSHSDGIWPYGEFDFNRYKTHPDDAANSSYGSHGIFVFTVPGRDGMGVHSGRERIHDGLGREGFLHCTMGCVRTTDEAMAQLVLTHRTDPIATIDIED